jgi:predicted DCC family thiol-disulfide oxidoreductase YuxK
MNTPVILFDGICNLCCGWVRFLIRHDKQMKFRFASFQSEAGEKLIKTLGLITGNMETIIYLKENHILRYSSAVLEILKEMGGIWKILTVFKLIPTKIRDRIYQFIACKRYTFFGKRSSCLLPTPEIKKRFLT